MKRYQGDKTDVTALIKYAGTLELQVDRAKVERDVALCALRTLRSVVNEDHGGIPRYTVTPGSGLNAVIEEEVDPVLRLFEA